MATQSSILAEESLCQRSLVGYRPRGRKEPDTTERLSAAQLIVKKSLENSFEIRIRLYLEFDY